MSFNENNEINWYVLKKGEIAETFSRGKFEKKMCTGVTENLEKERDGSAKKKKSLDILMQVWLSFITRESWHEKL